MKKSVTNLVKPDGSTVLNQYDVCYMMRDAYYSSHTRKNIEASFRRSGLWPFNPARLLSALVPLSTNEMNFILSAEALIMLMNQKKNEARRKVLGEYVEVLASGFINTESGTVLTLECAINALKEQI